MKKSVFKLRLLLTLTALSLVGFSIRTLAATLTDSYTNNFDIGANTTNFFGSGSVASWINWYGLGFNNTPMTNDVNMPDPNGGPNAGSLLVVSPFTDAGDQNVFFGTFHNGWGYDWTDTANFLDFDTISFDVRVAATNPITGLVQAPNTSTNFGSITVGLVGNGFGFENTGSATIPASASNGWVHLSVPVNHTLANLGSVGGIAFSYTSYSGYPKTNFVFWIGNLIAHYNPAPAPPPTLSNLQMPIVGLNCLATGSGQYDREQVATVNSTGYSFVGQSSVTYSWNIKSFPSGSDNNFQQHFFIVNGAPGPYDQAADWNLADCIFITVQQQTNGTGYLNFRYKTNEPGGNAMLFNGTDGNTGTSYPVTGAPSNPVVSLTASAPVGNWSVTFSDTTNVTITGPGGVSTNFVFDPASAALFADPASLLLGGQPNNPDGYGKAVVYSQFSASGNSSPFTDVFTNDTELNTNIWKNLSNDPNGLNLVPPSAAYWLGWSIPDYQFSPQLAASVSGPWQDLALPTIQVGAERMVLLSTSDLPAADQGYFRLVKRTFSQLQILWPGETNAPDTATGKIGTPDPVSLSVNSGIVYVTINAVDSTYHIVNVSGDQIIEGTGNDPNVIWAGDGVNNYTTLSGGTAQGVVTFANTGAYTLTLQDNTNTNIPPATSSSVTVNN